MSSSQTTPVYNLSDDEINGSDDHSVDFKQPLWQFVAILVPPVKNKGGNCTFQCTFCSSIFKGSYSRVRWHLLKMTGHGVRPCTISEEKRRELERLSEEHVESKKQNQQILPPLPVSRTSSSPSQKGLGLLDELLNDPSKKRKGVTGPLDKLFNVSAKEILDAEIARMFYTGGLSFSLAKNPHYVRAFNRACASSIAGYRPPGYNALRTSLLDKEKKNVDKLLAPIKYCWQQKGVSICSDGWSDTQRRPLINVMAVCESGPMFLKAVNCEGETKDKHFIANLLVESILQIGPQHVVQVITDNASNCKAAGAIVNARFSHIFWTPCVVHTLNLALKNICTPSLAPSNVRAYEACSWISDTAEDVWFIKNFIMNHGMRLAMFNEHSQLKMLSIADTRFASVVVMLKRFKKIKKSLETMVMSDAWEAYRDDDLMKARSVKEKIVKDEFWEKIDYILQFTLPIYGMLRRCDTDISCLHLVYEWWDVMIEEVKVAIYKHEGKQDGELSEFYEVVYTILLSRWTKSSSPLHCLAHSLNPR